jgi:hypothetical protein
MLFGASAKNGCLTAKSQIATKLGLKAIFAFATSKLAL